MAFTGDDPLTYWFAGDGNGNFGSAQSLLDPPIFLNDASVLTLTRTVMLT